jgi:hypothetical protein
MTSIIECIQERVLRGARTFLVKVKAHRGEPLNENSDTQAENARPVGPRLLQRVERPELELQGCEEVLELLDVVVRQALVAEQHAGGRRPQCCAQVEGRAELAAVQQHAQRVAHQVHQVAAVLQVELVPVVVVLRPRVDEAEQLRPQSSPPPLSRPRPAARAAAPQSLRSTCPAGGK